MAHLFPLSVLLTFSLVLPATGIGQTAAPVQQRSQSEGAAGRVPLSPRDGGDAAPQCQARWAAYRRSQACYAQFQTVYGGLRDGAVQACGEPLPDPSAECGLPTYPR